MNRNSFRPQESEWLRNLVELSILFLMAIILLRGFVLEGYLISTGSMAPGLLGLHKQVECPSCGQRFAYGVSFDPSVAADSASNQRLSKHYATCVNCGQADISVASVPANHGDQLLVHKGVFDFRLPRRWETAVFRNPADPGEAYVKRVVGLPGEQLQIQDGDLYIQGQIARKDLATQREMRLPVFDLQHPSTAEDWQLPWKLERRWQYRDQRLVYDGTKSDITLNEAPDNVSWIRYQNWRTSGGTHVVETPLSGEAAERDWLACLTALQQRPMSWTTRLQFDREREVLSLHGVMPYRMQQDLLAAASSEMFRAAVYRLGALSHISPVTDRYAYNFSAAAAEFPVRDLMLHAVIHWSECPHELVVHMPVENEAFAMTVNFESGRVSLGVAGSGDALRSSHIPDGISQSFDSNTVNPGHSGRIEIEVSNFDHRLLVAINGQQCFAELDLPIVAPPVDFESIHDPVEIARLTAEIVTQQSRLGLGVRGGRVAIESLALYRDVYYTPGKRRNAVEGPLKIATDAYFVQGDNSPVSSDSRNWAEPLVPHKLLVGKPFIVHLPSQPGKLSIGGFELPIRIPDWKRIRYIR